jgi:hypothetical protein
MEFQSFIDPFFWFCFLAIGILIGKSKVLNQKDYAEIAKRKNEIRQEKIKFKTEMKILAEKRSQKADELLKDLESELEIPDGKYSDNDLYWLCGATILKSIGMGIIEGISKDESRKKEAKNEQ